MPHTIKLHRVFKCTPERAFRAFIDPKAMVKWLPPHGFTAEMHSMDARVGGTYRMSFTNFNTGSSHAFGGKFLDLVPNEKLRYTDKFEDANLPGEMVTTVMFRKVQLGPMVATDIAIAQEGVPDVIPMEGCYLGWQESLELLAKLIEPEIPDGF